MGLWCFITVALNTFKAWGPYRAGSFMELAGCEGLPLFHGCFAKRSASLSYAICLLPSTNEGLLLLFHHCAGKEYVWSIFKSFMSEKEVSAFQGFSK